MVVFSCRADSEAGRHGIVEWLRKWDLLGLVDRVTSAKPIAIAYVDDRAVRFGGSWGPVLAGVRELGRPVVNHTNSGAGEVVVGEDHTWWIAGHVDDVTAVELVHQELVRTCAAADCDEWSEWTVYRGWWREVQDPDNDERWEKYEEPDEGAQAFTRVSV